MDRSEPTRTRLLAAMSAHILEHGLNDASLRPLAAAAGTSDRMLIYHFGSKEDLIASLLTFLGELFCGLLDDHLPAGRFASEREGILAILSLMRSDGAQGFQRVWFDILAASARGSAAHRETGGKILGNLHDWLIARMPPETTAARSADMLLRIEGILIAEAIGRGDLARASLRKMGVEGEAGGTK